MRRDDDERVSDMDDEREWAMIAAVRQHRLILSLAVAILITALFSLTIGSQPLPLLQALQESFGDTPGVYSLILTELRIPRTLVALLAGASLGLCGAVMQALLRNPLASPGLVGSASGAALGAVITLYFGVAGLFAYALPLGGMAGALLATLTAYLLAGRDGGTLTLILAGVAVKRLRPGPGLPAAQPGPQPLRGAGDRPLDARLPGQCEP